MGPCPFAREFGCKVCVCVSVLINAKRTLAPFLKRHCKWLPVRNADSRSLCCLTPPHQQRKDAKLMYSVWFCFAFFSFSFDCFYLIPLYKYSVALIPRPLNQVILGRSVGTAVTCSAILFACALIERIINRCGGAEG